MLEELNKDFEAISSELLELQNKRYVLDTYIEVLEKKQINLQNNIEDIEDE